MPVEFPPLRYSPWLKFPGLTFCVSEAVKSWDERPLRWLVPAASLSPVTLYNMR
jgi:hypothetical protein